MEKPIKISIVTPAFNMAPYISDTIESVLSQTGQFELEYIVIDGGSQDGTTEIIRSYADKVENQEWPARCLNIKFKWYSGKDAGMYDAINKGFSMASGDILAWLNADDMYQNGALEKVCKIFSTFPDVLWIKGLVKVIEANGDFIRKSPLRIYHRKWLEKGYYGRVAYFLEQDTSFWRKELWQKVKTIPTEYKYAGDYWLWKEFAKYAKLWSVNADFSVFRKRSDQLSQDMAKYKGEQNKIVPTLPRSATLVRILFNLYSKGRLKKLLRFVYKLFTPSELFIDATGQAYTKKKAGSFLAF